MRKDSVLHFPLDVGLFTCDWLWTQRTIDVAGVASLDISAGLYVVTQECTLGEFSREWPCVQSEVLCILLSCWGGCEEDVLR